MKKNKAASSRLLAIAGIVLSAAVIFLSLIFNLQYVQHIIVLSCMFASLTQMFNLMYGYVGISYFGFAAIFGAGGYISAILSARLGLPVWIAVILAAILSSILGTIIMFPCLKMGGFTVAIITLSYGEIIRYVINTASITGGARGFYDIPALFEARWMSVVAGVVMALGSALLVRKIMKTRLGLGFKMIHEDTGAAASCGVNTNLYKVIGTAIACCGAGLVGAFYAHYIMFLNSSLCSMAYTVQVMCMTLFGGIGTIIGPAIGGILLTFLTEGLRAVNEYRMIVFGLILMLFVVFFPKGVVGIIADLKKVRRRKTSAED